jgi:hypothetical protein
MVGCASENSLQQLSIPGLPVRRGGIRTQQTVEGHTMAQYMLLLYGDEAAFANATQEQIDQKLAAHGRFGEQLVVHGGKILASEALEPTSTATSVRGDVVTDGPFVETKEALGGFYLIEAENLDQALTIAKLCPSDGVEVRPVRDTSGA